MGADDILLETEEKMEAAVTHLAGEMRGLRTGRASPALVDSLRADYYGAMTPLSQMAQIGCPEPRLHDGAIVGGVADPARRVGRKIGILAEDAGGRDVLPELDKAAGAADQHPQRVERLHLVEPRRWQEVLAQGRHAEVEDQVAQRRAAGAAR